MSGGMISLRRSVLQAPIAGPNGVEFSRAMGSAQDDELALLRLAGLLRDPSRVPDEALGDVGTAYSMERYAGDTNESYRERLATAFDFYALAGSPAAIVRALKSLGIVDVRVLTEGYNKPIYEGSWYTRAKIVLGPDFGTSGIGPSELGVNTVLGSWILGVDMTAQMRATIKKIVWRWKDALALVPDVHFIFDPGGLLGVNTYLGGFVLGASQREVAITIVPQFGSQTYLGWWVLGGVDLS